MNTPANNYPATVAEVEQMLDESVVPGYRIETIGDWIHPPPKPLPDRLVERFAATIAEKPTLWGRLLRHVLREASRQ